MTTTIEDASRDCVDLVGSPYVKGACGPAAFDCWGLVVYVYRVYFDVELEPFAGDFDTLRKAVHTIDTERRRWSQLKEPRPLCVIGMSRTRHLHHVGLWTPLNGGSCLHAVEGAQVLLEPMRRIAQQGFRKLHFFDNEHITRSN